ncbi:MAG: hypothetical protein LBT41_06075, partial [Candidatus Methanoplasma sp.]|nr:hypothetical protein [Candidatus Methanoplasma sp.]
SKLKRGDIVVIDETWIYKGNEQLVDGGIEQMLNRGVPIIFVGKAQYLYKDSAASLQCAIYYDNPNVYAIYRSGIDFQMQSTSPNVEDDIALAYEWANVVSSSDEPYVALKEWNGTPIEQPGPLTLSASVSSSDVSWTLLGIGDDYSMDSHNCRLTHSKQVYKIDGVNNGFDYYMTHYHISARVNTASGYRIADIRLNSDFANGTAGPYAIETAPGTTSGSSGSATTYTVGGSINVGSGGAGGGTSYSVGQTYSYSISDMPLVNQSLTGPNGDLNYWYNVDETKGVGLGCDVDLAYIIKCSDGQSFTHSDEYMENIYHYNSSVILGQVVWSSYEPDHTLYNFGYIAVSGGSLSSNI